MFSLRSFPFIFLFALRQIGFSQIVDDSTKEIFGDHSTKYFLQEDVAEGLIKKRDLDTSINHLHYYNYQYTNGTWYQGLGNLGMAMKPVYYKAPEQLGYRLGFEAYHPYLNSASKQRYFDTKSPYSELQYLQGGTGEQRFFLLFTTNVNRYWNVGASYNRFTSAKQLAVIQARDFQTDHHQINAFTSVRTEGDKYMALANFNYMQHWSYESGGTKAMYGNETVIDSGMFLYKYADVNLFKSSATINSRQANALAARNYYKSLRGHLYHHFNPLDSGNNFLKVFHEFDWLSETQYFRDNNMVVDTSNRLFYKENNFDSVKAYYQFNYQLIQNKLGIKGNTKRLNYSLYYKIRNYTLLDASQDIATVNKQRLQFRDEFAGGTLGVRLNENLSINLSGEWMNGFGMNSHPDNAYYKGYGDHQANMAVRYKKWALDVGQSKVSPTLMQSRFVTNLAAWAKDKDAMQAVLQQQANLQFLHTQGERFIRSGVQYQRIDHLVYFARDTLPGLDNQKIRPIQHRGYIDYIQPSLSFRINWKWIYLENDLIVTHVFTDKDILHMPAWYTFPKLYYQNNLFKKATLIQLGGEVLLKANYYADFYAPQINQFYWQDTYKVPTFAITNAFVNLQIRQVRVFLRISNIFGDMTYQTGYMDTPYYPGMRRSFQFGLIWKAFD